MRLVCSATPMKEVLFMRRPILTATVVALVAVGLSSCGDDRPDRAITVDPSHAGENNGPLGQNSEDETGDAADEPPEAAGAQLTDAQAKAAVLTIQDMPSGWSQQPNDDDDSDDEGSTYEPAECQEVIDALDEDDEDPVAEAEVTFNNGGPFGTTFNETVSSYAEEGDAEAAQKVADAFSKCPKFTETAKDGTVSTYTVSPMSFPNLGDQTLAFAMTVESEGFTVNLNAVWIGIGHNAIALFNGGVTGASGADLEQFAHKAIARLEDAAS